MNHGMIRFIATLFLACLSLMAQGVETVIHYHNDALGSPIIATDQEGRVVWRKSYAPYGQPIGPAAPNEPGYTGKFEEPDLGIQNFGARWYDPRIGRFLAIDPAGFDPQNPQSFNRYAYANNNPYRFVDPNGESPLDVGFLIVDTVKLGSALYSGNSEAIASAGVDLAASAVGLASPIPGTGLAIKAARAADKVGDAAGVAKGSTEIVQRAMSRAELNAIQNTGFLSRGERAGDHFVSDTVNSSANRARQRLALPQTPEVRATLEVPSGVFSKPTKVGPGYNMPGGGMERTAPGKVDIPARVVDVLEH
ncbi:MAG: RHS repeat domain-containing protein [Chromatiales bacterium]